MLKFNFNLINSPRMPASACQYMGLMMVAANVTNLSNVLQKL